MLSVRAKRKVLGTAGQLDQDVELFLRGCLERLKTLMNRYLRWNCCNLEETNFTSRLNEEGPNSSIRSMIRRGIIKGSRRDHTNFSNSKQVRLPVRILLGSLTRLRGLESHVSLFLL